MNFIVFDMNALTRDQYLGRAFLSLNDLLNGNGDRIGYEVIPEQGELPSHTGASSPTDTMVSKNSRLYIRVRHATDDDIEVLSSVNWIL